jgi:16S rRNA (uracil1498-N3)-methyltransferase
MNLILLFETDFIGPNLVRVKGQRFEHIQNVIKSKINDTLKVGLLNGKMGTGKIITITDKFVEIETTLDQPPPPPLQITLLIALPRPKALRRIIGTITTLGIKKLYLFRTWRVESSYWQTPLLKKSVLHEEMLSGLSQACDTILPKIEIRKEFKPFLEDEVPTLIKNTVSLAAHPGASQICPCSLNEPVTLAIGPEGGFIQYELDKLQKTGFSLVSLGERVLRVEQAVPAFVGRLISYL